MGAVDSMPVVSQTKSAVQAIAGDTKGARETQMNFLNTCPVVSQGKSFVHWCDGDNEAARKTQLKFVKGVSDFADGVPVVGHVKGGIHYACCDEEGGDNAMKSASRSVGVIGGGIAGGLVGGPVGAVAGGIAGGVAMDGITTGVDSLVHDEYRPSGQVAVTNMVNGKASVGDYFDSVAGVAFDGASGYGAGKAAMKYRDTRNNVQLYRVAGQEEVNNSVKAGKLVKHQATQGEYWMSESSKHSRPYYKSRNYPNKSALKAKVPRKAYSKIKSDMIKQSGSKAKQAAQAKAGKGPANIYNTERLHNHPSGKVNIGIKGDANLQQLNKHVHGVREIHVDSWKYKNGFTRGVARYGKGAAGALLHPKLNCSKKDEEEEKKKDGEKSKEEKEVSTSGEISEKDSCEEYFFSGDESSEDDESSTDEEQNSEEEEVTCEEEEEEQKITELRKRTQLLLAS